MNPLFKNASKSFKDANPRFLHGLGQKDAACANSVRPRGTPGRMNDTEAKFALRLEGMKRAGEIDGWMYESIRVRLADRTTYSPDFYSWKGWTFTTHDGAGEKTWYEFVFYEIKGFRRDDAMVKFKIAREQYPWADFQMWSFTKQGWKQIL